MVVTPAVVDKDVVLPVVVVAPTTSPPQAAAKMAPSAITVTVERFITLCTDPNSKLVRGGPPGLRSHIRLDRGRESLLTDVLVP